MQQGDSLPTIQKIVTQSRIGMYADASGDHNPIHLDSDFASSTDFGGAKLNGTIAHGMMILASISEMLTVAFGEDWLSSGSLKVRFRGPVYPGENISTFGTVKKASEINGAMEFSCTVGVRKDNGDISISGDATVLVASGG